MQQICTVGDIRRAIEGLGDDAEIVLRIFPENGDDWCGPVSRAAVEVGHDDDQPFLALDAYEEEPISWTPDRMMGNKRPDDHDPRGEDGRS